MNFMMKILFLLLPLYLYAVSPFDTPKETHFNLSVFNTKKTLANKQVMKNKKLQCRYVCDKKIYKEQKISEALLFYKNTTKYKLP